LLDYLIREFRHLILRGIGLELSDIGEWRKNDSVFSVGYSNSPNGPLSGAAFFVEIRVSR
jgi:hypothetical protein